MNEYMMIFALFVLKSVAVTKSHAVVQTSTIKSGLPIGGSCVISKLRLHLVFAAFVALFTSTELTAGSAEVLIETPPRVADDTYLAWGQPYPVFENIVNDESYGSLAYVERENETRLVVPAHNSGHELIWLGVHDRYLEPSSSPISVNLNNANIGGQTTDDVSLVLSSANVNDWAINVESGVQLKNVFIIALGSESQTIDINGENGAFDAGDDGLIAGVNILRSNTTSSCGYEFPSSDPSQGCDTEVALGLEFNDAFSKVNILEDMQSGSGAPLELTSFNGTYYADKFTISVNSVGDLPAAEIIKSNSINSAVVSAKTPPRLVGNNLYTLNDSSHVVHENTQNHYPVFSTQYYLEKAATGLVNPVENDGEELIFLGLHETVDYDSPNLYGNGSVTVNVNNLNSIKETTRPVSLVLSAGLEVNWRINVDAGIHLKNIFVVGAAPLQRVDLAGSDVVYPLLPGDEYQGAVNGEQVTILRSPQLACGYVLEVGGGLCNTAGVIGMQNDTNTVLAAMTDLRVTSFNGAHHVNSFNVDISSGLNQSYLPPLSVEKSSFDSYTVSWDSAFQAQRFRLYRGTDHFTSLGLYVSTSWELVQSGGTQYFVTGEAIGRYRYKLVEMASVFAIDALIPIHIPKSRTAAVSVLMPPNLNGPSSSDTGNYALSSVYSGFEGKELILEKKVAPGIWLPQVAGAFNMISGATVWNFSNQYDGTHEYRARVSFAGCLAILPGCVDDSLATTKFVSVNRTLQSLRFENGLLRWNLFSSAPHNVIEEQLAHGDWQIVHEGSGSSFGSADPAKQYRVKSCEIDAQGNPSVCTGYSIAGIREVPLPAQKPSVDFGDDTVGSINGSFTVNEAGAAIYSIPIMTATGAAGVAPRVSLNYSSQAGNGIAGKGWSLNAGRTVSRCRQTLQTDGQAKAVTWTEEDRFCLDGQRLLVLDNVPYGSEGAQYKTEIDSFVRVTSHGPNLGHPDYFTVEGKDGSVTYFGASGDGTVLPNTQLRNDNGQTLTWAIAEFQDSISNQIKYRYLNDTDGFALERIDYAFGATAEMNNSNTSDTYVHFQYVTRPDPIGGYQSGFQFRNTRRLDSIQTYSEYQGAAELLRSYHISYIPLPLTQDSGTNRVSRIESIQECSGVESHCVLPTVFNWGLQGEIDVSVPGNNDHLTRTYSGLAKGDKEFVSTYTLLDFNGDGLQDIAWMTAYESGTSPNYDQRFQYAQATESGFEDALFYDDRHKITTTDNPLNGEDDTGKYIFQVIDYNADGRDDLLRHRQKPVDLTGTWELFLSTPLPDGSWRLKQMPIDASFPFALRNTSFTDINSDGLLDAVIINKRTLTVHYLEPNPDESRTSATPYHFGSAHDISNDALIYQYGGPTRENTKDNPMIKEFLAVYPPPQLIDVDGNGQMELMVILTRKEEWIHFDGCTNVPTGSPCTAKNSSHSLELLSLDSESSSFSTMRLAAGINPYRIQTRIGDINGDGLADWLYKDQAVWRYHINTGTLSLTAPSPMGVALDFEIKEDSLQLVDLNYDGYADIQWVDKDNNEKHISYWDPVAQEFSDDLSSTSVSSESTIWYGNRDDHAYLDKVDMHKGDPDTNLIITNYFTNNSNAYDNIHTITNGMGAITHIDYESMIASDNYVRVAGIGKGESADDFYRRLNDPFYDLPANLESLHPETSAPIFEVIGPMPIVTRVEGSAPAANESSHSAVDHSAMSAISYVYHEAKMQAAGRGYLGFKKIETIDEQTGIKTTTRYRQDYPYIGMPISTTVQTGGGKLLSVATNDWDLQYANEVEESWTPNFGDAADDGWRLLGSLQPILSESIEKSYTNQSTNDARSYLDGLILNGDVLATVVTRTDRDIYNNIENITIETWRGENDTGTLVKRQTTTNQFTSGGSDAAGWAEDDSRRLGRLWRSEVAHERPELGETKTHTSAFLYYPMSNGGLLKTETIAPGHPLYELTTTYQYNNFGNKTHATQTAADARNGTVGSVAANDRQVRWEYDSSGRYRDKTYNALNQLVENVKARNRYGAPTLAADITGVEVHADYTPLGKPYLTYAEDGSWTHTSYDRCPGDCPSGAVYSVTTKQAGGGRKTEYFDVLGRSIQTNHQGFADGDIVISQVEYDALGRVVRQSTPYYTESERYWSETHYDILGRPVNLFSPTQSNPIEQTINYNGLITTTETISNNPTAMIDQAVISQSTIREVNVLGEVVKVIDALQGTVDYTYSVEGLLRTTSTTAHAAGGGMALGVTQPVTITLDYDPLGRKDSMIDPDKGAWTYVYNGFGELIEQYDANGNATHMDYDALGRMVKREDWRDPDGDNDPANLIPEGSTHWIYDTARVGPGHLDTIHDAESGFTQVFDFDSLGRQYRTTTTTGTAANDTTYTTQTAFDRYGRVLSKWDATGQGTFYSYNANGYLESVGPQQSGINYFEVRAMTARGQVKEVRWGNLAVSTRTYDPAKGTPISLVTTDSMLQPLQDLELEFDDFGNLISRINQGVGQSANTSAPQAKDQTEEYRYDALNRLRETNWVGGSTQSLTYDSYGNIKNKSDVGDYTYGENGAGPHAVSSTSDGATYQYDANGNMISDTTTGGGRTLVYSSFDKPTQIIKGNHQIDFSYGPGRSRYKRIDINSEDGSVDRVTLYLGSVERITFANGTVEDRRYIDGQVLITDTTANNVSTSSIQYLIKDNLGSTELVLAHTVGALDDWVLEDMSFDPWGHRREVDTLVTYDFASWQPLALFGLNQTTSRGFTGHEMLDEVGLIHMNGRIYDPKLGRFLQADPFIQAAASSQSYNRYSYGFNNPLNGVDESGYIFATIAFLGAKFLGATLVEAALVAAITTFASALIQGAELGDALMAGVSSFALSYVGGELFGYDAGISFGLTEVLQFSTLGGITSVLQGGKFGHGFVSAGFGAAAGGLLNRVGLGRVASDPFGRHLVAAVVGGTASDLTGLVRNASYRQYLSCTCINHFYLNQTQV